MSTLIFVGGHESFAQFDFIKDQVITINGVSKGFAMTGWRGGIMAAPKWIAQACDKIAGAIYLCYFQHYAKSYAQSHGT